MVLRMSNNRKLTSERPTMDPCILGSAIGDLFPENRKLSINYKQEREH